MTIQECYMALGGNYAEVAKRLPSESLVKRSITKFPDDKSFAELSQAMAEGDRARAFSAAHTLKGDSANLSLDQLLRSAVVLTELLRQEAPVIPTEAYQAFEEVKRNYDVTIRAIHDFLNA